VGPAGVGAVVEVPACLQQQAPDLGPAALSSMEPHAQFRIVAELLGRVLGLFHQRVCGEVAMLGNPSLVGVVEHPPGVIRELDRRVMSASSPGCPLGAQGPEHLVRRHGLAGSRLRQRAFESGLEPSPLFVTHVVIHRSVDALEERVGDLQPHRLVEPW
jgi:hypothetical protein